MENPLEGPIGDFVNQTASSTLADLNAELASSSASTTVASVFDFASSSYAQVYTAVQGLWSLEEGWFAMILGFFDIFSF
jgi:hypothetical protein